MSRLLRGFVLGLPVLVDGQSERALLSGPITDPQRAVCGIAFTNGIDTFLDTGTKLYPLIKSCQTAGQTPKRNKILTCVADAGDLLAAIANLASVIFNILSSCAYLNIPGTPCIQSGLALTGSVSRLAAAGGYIDLACVHKQKSHKNTMTCLLDVKQSVHSGIGVISSILSLKSLCSESPAMCASGSFEVIAAFGNMANFVLASIGNCMPQSPFGSDCGASISAVSASIAEIVAEALHASQVCAPAKLAAAASSDAKSDTPVTSSATADESLANDFVKWAKTQMKEENVTTKILQANIAEAIKRNLTEVHRLFSNHDNDGYAGHAHVPDDPVPDSRFTVYALLGALPITLLVGFVAGRRVSPRRLTSFHLVEQQTSCLSETGSSEENQAEIEDSTVDFFAPKLPVVSVAPSYHRTAV